VVLLLRSGQEELHCTMCKHMGLQVTDKFCEHIPERVIHVKGTTIMWDVPGITYQTVLANHPDIVLHDKKKENTCLQIGIAIPDD
jgi:hypothetical protein